jgi:hypothetical protein
VRSTAHLARLPHRMERGSRDRARGSIWAIWDLPPVSRSLAAVGAGGHGPVLMGILTARGNRPRSVARVRRPAPMPPRRVRHLGAELRVYGCAHCAAGLPAAAHGRYAGGFRLLHGSRFPRG